MATSTKSRKTSAAKTSAKKTSVPTSNLQEALLENFGFSQFKGQQEDIIKTLMSGKDTFVIMPTGGGKSLCYQLPALMLPGVAIIVSPLIALMKNQVDLVRGYSSKDDVAHFLNSTLNKKEIREVHDDLLAGRTKMLYVAPETLTKQENLAFFSDLNISFFAVDEAHCISEWGHDFRPEYRRLREMMEQINDKIPVIALTATATPKVQSDIVKNLSLRDPEIFISSFNRDNLYYEIQPKINKEQTIRNMVKFIVQNKGKSGIIYTLNRKTTEELAQLLVANGIKAVAYHAGLDSKLRAERQDKFLHEDTQVIVATIAFGMGIDKPDVRFVIHYNIPKSIENYYQETGRAGRDGLEGTCILYYSHKDVAKLEHLMRDKPLSEREVGAQLINETVAYAESGVCRRKILLSYFGEEWKQDNCGHCDNCRHPKEQVEAKENAVKLLKLVKVLDERFATDYVVNVITGHLTPQNQMYRHNAIELFGAGKEEPAHYWQSLTRQLLLAGLLSKDIEEYGLLKMTKAGESFLKKPKSFKIVLNNLFEDANEDDEDGGDGEGGAVTAVDEKLFEMLKELRQKEAKRKSLPPFVIFLETSLQDMATLYPTTVAELDKCQGVSKGKAIRYGKPFVEMIAKYVEENDIQKPDEFVMKSVVNKSGLKVYIIQQTDKRIALETIARNKELRLDSLLEEMETIAASGTKLNLDYAIDEMLDEYEQEEILDYFKGCETSSLQVAQEELADSNFTWEQLKIMRIKFLAQYGM
ncbi:DNA helicase RecQ [Flavihumibacter petaseus]|uniref:DNA helicase RecQ n=1 Tax=Flavihumibacter petaseus NBRC 106054 TaxID=1220578 RepID=A0A0E9MXX5_9BACT|nr:DNA helicase RecQ [Flavihumibacter petaseus]GAO42286.1 ATP-dependent DNA helicase RecQ [Flavihumibacter petaseus NBRC 106054]